jgi:thiazolylpeptide-type bacteriocin precursor
MRTKIGSRAGRFKGKVLWRIEVLEVLDVLEVLKGTAPSNTSSTSSTSTTSSTSVLQIPVTTLIPTRNSGFPGSLWYAQSKIM